MKAALQAAGDKIVTDRTYLNSWGNRPGKRNAYNADGNKVGTISAEKVGRAAGNVDVIITEDNG